MLELDAIRTTHGNCEPGGAVVTTAGNLPAKYVFHAVGPIYKDGKSGEPEILAAAYRSCLRLAESKEVAYLSFPSISTGAYGYPVKMAAPIAIEAVVEHLSQPEHNLQRVLFVLFDERTFDAYSDALQRRTE